MPNVGLDDLTTDELRLAVAGWNFVLDELALRRITTDAGAAVLFELEAEHVHDLLDIIDGRTARPDLPRKFVSLDEMAGRLGLG